MTNKFDSQIQTALTLLDPKDDTHWTQDGLPVVELVAKISEIKGLKRGDITKAAPTFTRENPSFEAAKPPEEQTPPPAEGDLPGQDTIAGTLAEDAVGVDDEGNDITIKAGDEVIVNKADLVEEEEDELEEDPMDSADAQLAAAEETLAIANKQLADAQALKAAAQSVKDAILEERSKNVHPHQNQIDIMEFLAGQAKLREARAARINPQYVSPKAPIDQAMGRKSGYGHSRPKVPLKTNGA